MRRQGRRRGEEEKMHGGWNQKVKRRIRKSHTVLWNEAEGVSVNLEGESHHEQTQAKITRREREDQAQMERKADRKAPGEEGEESRSPKKKVIRVESERNAGLCEIIIELEQRNKFSARRDQHPAKPMFWGDKTVAVTKPSVSGSLFR